jgi:hypothetical protein
MATGLLVVSDAEKLRRHPADLDHGALIQVVDFEFGYGRVVGTVCRGLALPSIRGRITPPWEPSVPLNGVSLLQPWSLHAG